MQFLSILFLNMGGSELFLIVLVILLFFGSKGIPEIARGLGKGIREMKNAANGIQEEITKSTDKIKEDANLNEINEEIKKSLKED